MTVVTWQAMRTIAAISPSTLFPGACKKQDGDLLLVAPRMTHHLSGDGDMWAMTGVDNGNGTVTWRDDWTKIWEGTHDGKTYDVRCGIPRLIPSGPLAGRVAIIFFETWWETGSISNQSSWPTAITHNYTRVLISTDEDCTAWTLLSTLPTSVCNDSIECPIAFLPNGDWVTATYSRETTDFISWYSAAFYRSTNNGTSWVHEGFVGPRANTAEPQDQTYLADEPFLLMLDSGELLCMIRAIEAGNPQPLYHHLYRCSNPTEAGDLVWTLQGRTPATPASSRCALLQHGSGMILHAYRRIVGGVSSQGVYQTSDNDGVAWGTERRLDSGVVDTGSTSTGSVYSYGDWVPLSDGSLIHVYCNDNYTSSTIREARFTTDWTPPPPIDPPDITGSDVADITLTGASIVANVNPNGEATTYRVQYGLTTSYGTNTDWASAGSGSSPVAIEVPLTGLSIDTTYHARVVATNADGTTNGPDVPFTTDDLGLTIAGSSIWTQDGYDLTVTGASANTRHSTTATVASRNGGTVRFTGADAAAFYVSSDGSTWASSLTVPAGSTDIHVSVLATPEPNMASLSATMLIPV